MAGGRIRGEQIKDESVESVDLASGSIKAGELNSEAISGQTLITSTDTTNDRLLIWDATDSALKQVSPGNLGISGGGGGSPAGADTQVQFNDGGANFGASSNFTFDDTTLTVSTTGLNPIFNLAATNDGNSASPIFTLKRNSSSPADADYLGQIKFQGENDADQEVAYAKITGKIDDASDGSEDGILEFANVKNGSQTITARLRSDSLQLLNGTNLSVDGTAEISGFLYHKDDNDTYIKFEDDDINFQAGGVNMIDITQSANSEITFNEAAADVDFRVEGSGNANLLFVDAGNNSVGIGTNSPDAAELLTIDGVSGNHEANIQFREDGANRAKIGINDSDNLVLHNQFTNKHIVLKVNDQGVTREGLRVDGAVPEVVVNEGSESLVDFRVESDNKTHMLFVDGANDRVGIGTVPQTTLHVHADSINDGAVTISQADNSGDASQLDLSKARGTGASPSAVQGNDFLGHIRFLGYDGDSYDNFADIYVQASGSVSTTSHPGKIVMRTVREGATSLTEAVTIDSQQNLTVNGNIYARMNYMTHHRYNDGSGTGLEYIPWAGTSEQNSPSWITQGVAPYEGKLSKVFLRSSKSGGMGSTTVGIHTNVNGNSVISSTPAETVIVNMSSANTTYTFNFSNVTHFGPGDVIGVSIDPTNAHGNVNVTCVWEYDII